MMVNAAIINPKYKPTNARWSLSWSCAMRCENHWSIGTVVSQERDCLSNAT